MRFKSIILIVIFVGVGLLLSMANSNNYNNLEVFPNPVTDGQITIRADKEIDKIEIINMIGEVIHIYTSLNINNIELDLDIKSGLYLIRVSYVDDTKNTKRFWVN